MSIAEQMIITDGLNAEQYQAVTLGKESSLILAGAGSGKTRVLTSRIAWLINTGMAKEENILAVTFTNKSAREMVKRLTGMLGREPKGLWMGTFHSICYRMLREHRKELGLPNVIQVLDESDMKAQVRRTMETLMMPKEQVKSLLGQATEFISFHKENGVRAKDSNAPDPAMLEIYAEYENLCNREGMMDFGELLMRTNEYLAEDKGNLRTFFNNKFTDILIDEFQDTNDMQYLWLDYLHNNRATVMAVGDDDQSIYSFRGARPEGMHHFAKTVANGNIIRLEQNYRSTGIILEAANAVIANNPDRIGKRLRTDSIPGSKISFRRYENDLPGKFGKPGKSECENIAKTIKAMITKGANPGEIAVLYRSNHQSAGIERYLAREGVPYTIYGGTKFYERSEVKDAVAYIRLASNVKDDLAFMRIVNFPPRGIGDKAVEKIAAVAREQNISLAEALRMEADAGNEKLMPFADMLDQFAFAVSNLPMDMSFRMITEVSGLQSYFTKAANGKTNKQEKEEEMERAHRLDELVNIASAYIAENPSPEIQPMDMIEEFLMEAVLDGDKSDDKKKVDASVTLMTVHAAKGLEFDNVVLAGVDEGIFPHERSLENVEEERRLMYVAITRARKNLMITSSQFRTVYGKRAEFGPSRFISEIPEGLVHMVDSTNTGYNPWHAPEEDPLDENNMSSEPAPEALTQVNRAPESQQIPSAPRRPRF